MTAKAPGKKRRLGRGLEALMGDSAGPGHPGGTDNVPLYLIDPNPLQPRANIDPESVTELAASIGESGLLQPLVLRPLGPRFQIIAGERRFRAVQSLGWQSVAAVCRDLTDSKMLVAGLVENLQREDLSPIEEAAGYRRLMDEFGLTQEQVAAQVGKGRPTVANMLRLLRLPGEIRDGVARGELSAGHGRALLGMPRAETAAGERRLIALGRETIDKGWSVRQLEHRVRGLQTSGGAAGGGQTEARERDPMGAPASDPAVRRVELALERGLATRVRVRARANGGGTVSVYFNDDGDLLRLVERIAGDEAVAGLTG